MCAGAMGCAEGVCSGGACLLARNDALCAPAEFCDPAVGCRPRTEVPDAGPLDGGGANDASTPDAGTDAGGASDVGTGGGGGFDGGLGPALGWTLTFGGPSADRALTVLALADGTVLTGGFYDGPVSIAGQALDGPAGIESSFMARLEPSSGARWVGSNGEGEIRAFGANAIDRLYVGGVFRNALQMGAASRTGDANGDGFLAALDADGVGLWSRPYTGSGTDLGPYDIWFSPAGIEVIATIATSCGFVAGQASQFETLDPDGNLLASQSFDVCTEPEVECGDPHDGTGNHYTTETFVDRLQRGGTNYRTNGMDDFLVVQYDAAFTDTWAVHIGGTGVDRPYATRLVGGEVWVLGLYDGAVDFGGTMLTSSAPDGLFMARVGLGGTITGAFDMGTLTRSGVTALLADDEVGNVYFALGFSGSADVLGTPVTAPGTASVVVGSVGPAGATRWAAAYGDSLDGSMTVRSMTVGGGFVYLAGFFSGTTALPGGSRTSAGSVDGFIARLSADSGLP